MLNEMRFHIPPSEMEGEDPVEEFRDQVMKKASVVTTSGDAIAIFRDIKCLSPRGRYGYTTRVQMWMVFLISSFLFRYDIKIFPTFFHLHGRTFDYKISTSSVVRLFLLPDRDQRDMHFIVNVDPPLKQGILKIVTPQIKRISCSHIKCLTLFIPLHHPVSLLSGNTRYHYLVFSFKQEEEIEIELPFTDEEVKEKFDGKLEREMNGSTFEVLSKILKALTGKKVTIPGTFVGHSGTPAVSCSHKTQSGFIYPLERGFIFLYKPPIYIRFDEVRNIDFERSGGSTR